MIISRTPFRISLFGGGTDYPAWYRQHGGAVLGMTIDKYCYISVRTLPPFFDHRHRIVYSTVELVREFSEIKHPVVRAVLGEIGPDCGLEIHHDGDLPARSGLGSSSSFTVGLLNAMHAFYGRMSSSKQLAMEAIRMEQEVVQENVGSQDQIWAAFGGLNVITFRTDDSFDVVPIPLSRQRRLELQDHLMLFFTGISRYSSTIAGQKIANLENRRRQLTIMGSMVNEAVSILTDDGRPIGEIGRLLHESWSLKRELAEAVTNSEVDGIYEAARSAGAVGGKLLGAGGGGFMLIFARPEVQPAIRERLSRLVEVSFEVGSSGSRIVVYEPNGLGQV
jgi:D-glycero-alpha-D-manno-heptose-7-phosphate kinase